MHHLVAVAAVPAGVAAALGALATTAWARQRVARAGRERRGDARRMTSHPVRIGLVGCGRLAELGYIPALDTRTARSSSQWPTPIRFAADRAASIAAAAARAGRDVHRRDHVARTGSTPTALVLASAGPTCRSPTHVGVDGRGCRCSWRNPPRSTPGAATLAALMPPPWIGFNRRYDPGARQRPRRDTRRGLRRPTASRSTTAGAVGAPTPSPTTTLLDLGPHLVDWARWLTRSEVTDGDRAVSSPNRGRGSR